MDNRGVLPGSEDEGPGGVTVQALPSHHRHVIDLPWWLGLLDFSTDLPSVPALPDDFTLCQFSGEQEVAVYAELYRSVFESTAMNAAWRARTLRMPTYRPELDLVISTPDSVLDGFCVGWFAPERQMAQVELLGVHPRFHQMGLARILLLEMLHRFNAHGVSSGIVETDLARTAARRAYESVGFQQINAVCFESKKCMPG